MQPKEYSFIHSLQPFENSLIILIMNELSPMAEDLFLLLP